MRRMALAIALFAASVVPARADDPEAQARAALREAEPVIEVDETLPGRPVVAVRFAPNHGKVTDDLLIHLKAFPRLRTLELPNKKLVTDAGLAHLSGHADLEDFVLNGTNASAAGIVGFLKGRTRLKRLHLSGAPLRDDDLAVLETLTELRELSLRGTLATSAGVVHLRPLAKLRWLNLDTRNQGVGDAALAYLAGLTDLEDLDLDRTGITDAGLAHLAALPKLRRLQFAFTDIGDAGLARLQSLPRLEGVNARGTRVTQQGVDLLKRRLPAVEVGFGPAPKR